MVPQIPANRCTGMAPTTSSILNLSSSGTVSTTMIPPTAPIHSAPNRVGASGSAVIDTRPANAPFSTMVRSGFLYSTCVRIRAVTAPAAAAMLVLAKMRLTSDTSPTVPIASCEPPLKPNQPSHRMNVPSVASARFEPGIGFTLPSLPYLPKRGPSTMAPAKAAQPPTECTTVEPAKSENPASANQPPPHCHEPEIGYITPVRSTTKARNGHSLIRSASAPDTIEAVAATKTNWKKKSEPIEAYPRSASAADTPTASRTVCPPMAK